MKPLRTAVGGSTVYRTKRRFVLGNLAAALSEESRPGADRKLSGKEEALLVATACSRPPEGRARWTLELLAGELVQLTEHGSISRERRSTATMWPAWRMCSISTQNRPIRSAQWSVLTRVRPNSLARSASRSHRRGASPNAMIASTNAMEQPICSTCIDPRGRLRSPTAGQLWTSPLACASSQTLTFPTQSASESRWIICRRTPRGVLYQAFPAYEARRVLRRREFHYVPKHASWLNMVEIEIGVLRGQCLDRRIATKEQLKSEIAAWQRQRNASGARIKWMFTTEKARAKMGRAYPQLDTVPNPPLKES